MLPPANNRMSLTEWEQTLQAYCSHVSLLSEIPLTPTDIDQIGQHLRALVRRSQANELRGQLARYRCTWVVYMAAIAARNDDRGYWNALGESLGVTGGEVQRAHLGAAFLDAIHNLGLPDFKDAGGYPTLRLFACMAGFLSIPYLISSSTYCCPLSRIAHWLT